MPSEFADRLARLRATMRTHGAAAMLIDDPEILAYYTGFEVSVAFYRACIVPLEGSPVMVLRRLDVVPFLERAWFTDHHGFGDTEDAVQVVADMLRERGLDHAGIGVDFGSHAMSVDVFRRLQAALPRSRFVDMTGVPWEQRLIKSPAEIDCIRRACEIADETMRGIVGMVRPGMTKRDCAAFAARRYVELGAVPGIVGPITSGSGWDHLHGHLDDKALTAGEILHLELIPRYDGYSGRLMRCVAVGGASPALVAADRQLAAIQDAQIAAMRPGAVARDVDAVLRGGVLEAGLRDAYENITGYTIGYYSNQPLRASDFTRVFSPDADWVLEAGMVFHMYASARGLAYSETVHVTPDGPKRLNRIERRLFEC